MGVGSLCLNAHRPHPRQQVRRLGHPQLAHRRLHCGGISSSGRLHQGCRGGRGGARCEALLRAATEADTPAVSATEGTAMSAKACRLAGAKARSMHALVSTGGGTAAAATSAFRGTTPARISSPERPGGRPRRPASAAASAKGHRMTVARSSSPGTEKVAVSAADRTDTTALAADASAASASANAVEGQPTGAQTACDSGPPLAAAAAAAPWPAAAVEAGIRPGTPAASLHRAASAPSKESLALRSAAHDAHTS